VRGLAQEDGSEGAADDAALLAACARGEQPAFAALARRHYDAAYRVAWRMTAGHADSEDIVQDVFLKLWKDPRQIRDAQALRGWILRAVSNRAIDRFRRKPHDALDEVNEPRALADRTLERDGVANEVDRAIAQLPERQRQALALVYFEGMGNIAAAAALEISVEAVESLLARAKRGLKAIMAGRRGELLDDLDRLDE
jgi:RNA polymerase sigma-70 factor, ECF subfamily